MSQLPKYCQFCGKNDASWNCYTELAKDPKVGESFTFCEDCKSKWVHFARAHGVEFDKVDVYRDGCSCHYLLQNGMTKEEVQRLWLLFIAHKLWRYDESYTVPEKVDFT